ncbi:glycerol-3-phosphate 1-O-acyltransferase PlsY [Anaeromicropila herbilytica]|uniref:Glycerol-3-phosphate acyltransferase n=1 Tax=Anaeromicropila herbilytica TaxID=2785025 RepID=A0A7R7IDP8_9FIRM|nr:glycerol-3-phosphate 1-O-acyltransferase PlsY [Anaeromicropila herbilytica]BCN31309.1 glycerol-3-phosphate acyltransferase [Anaeromicropila herbilytica]
MNTIIYVISICVGYIFGCFPTGFIVGKAYHVDIRNQGSGNIGSTNALRTLGKKAGLLTFAGDLLKAIIPIVAFGMIANDGHVYGQMLTLCTGLGVVIGHNFPVTLGFKGGKGIACMSAVILTFDLRITLIALIVFILTVVITRYVSLGSLLISLVLPLGVLVFYPSSIHMLFVSLIFTVFAFIKHQANIKRLLNGTENKIGHKKA